MAKTVKKQTAKSSSKGAKSRANLKVPAAVQEAYVAAVAARRDAYAPYSHFHVGAALITRSGAIVTGCNVENASYGGTICAERTAILKSVSEGEREFADVVVVTNAETPAFPCALCLQTMAEFFEPETRVWIADLQSVRSMHEFAALLPQPFGPRQLNAAPKGRA